MRKLHLYYGTVRTPVDGRHIMVWAKSRRQALNMVESALTTSEAVLGSVVGPIASLPADVMQPGVFVEATRQGAAAGTDRPPIWERSLTRWLDLSARASNQIRRSVRDNLSRQD